MLTEPPESRFSVNPQTVSGCAVRLTKKTCEAVFLLHDLTQLIPDSGGKFCNFLGYVKATLFYTIRIYNINAQNMIILLFHADAVWKSSNSGTLP